MSRHVLGIGEVLWDLLPTGAQLGGAPANFAYHARALGADAGVITRIGSDSLGNDILRRFLQQTNVLKLNEAELPVLAALFGLSGSVSRQLAELARRFELKVVALTRGPQGSLLLGPGGWFDQPGLPVEVRDTVGAGDAFTAALTVGLLQGMALEVVNRLANEVARHVCSCAGATPPLPAHFKAAFATP